MLSHGAWLDPSHFSKQPRRVNGEYGSQRAGASSCAMCNKDNQASQERNARGEGEIGVRCDTY